MMIIKLHQIHDEPTKFQFQIKPNDLEKLEERLTFDQMECEAILAKKTDAISLKGHYRVHIHTQCDLCLCPISLEMSENFELFLQEESEFIEPEGDQEITLQLDDVELFDGQNVNLTRYFEDQLLLDLPFSMTCGDDCKGLCPNCGTNLNETECQCARDSGSHPFSILKDISS